MDSNHTRSHQHHSWYHCILVGTHRSSHSPDPVNLDKGVFKPHIVLFYATMLIEHSCSLVSWAIGDHISCLKSYVRFAPETAEQKHPFCRSINSIPNQKSHSLL